MLENNAVTKGVRTAVVVAAHRMYEGMDTCLAGLLRLVKAPRDLIFVDNGSGGKLSDWARERFPQIEIIEEPYNKLFCGGYNAGIRNAMDREFDYVLLVNADCRVLNYQFLAELEVVMQQNPRAAFVGPQVLENENGDIQTTSLRYPRFFENLLIWLPYRIMPRFVSRQSTRLHQAEYLNGVCVLCRLAALRRIGVMDETFGAYLEDAEWSLRARNSGWHSLFVPVPSVVHHVEKHGYEHYSFKVFLIKRNLVYWYLRAGRMWSARMYVAFATILAMIRWLTELSADKRSVKRAFLNELTREYAAMFSSSRSKTAEAISIELRQDLRKTLGAR